jgi:elongation factor Ts
MAADLVKHVLSTSEAAAELLTQKFVLNPAMSVKEALMDLNARTGENVALPRSDKFAVEGHGRVDSYVHHDNKSGAMVELSCASAEQAATEEVKQLAKDLALQVVASNPLAIDRDGIPAELVEEQRQIIAKQLENDPANAKKPEQIQVKIAEGMLNKWYAENNLLDQPFAKDAAMGTVGDVIRKVSGATGGTIKVKRITRYVLGESSSPDTDEE